MKRGAAGSDVDGDDESSPSRIALSALIVMIVIAVVAGNFGDVGLQGTVKQATQPIRTLTGLNQHWDAFAPNPRADSTYVDGRVDFADGSHTTYRIVTRHGPGAYVDYRWQKFEESLSRDDALWPAYAMYLAERARATGREPVRVSLIRRSSTTLAPGSSPQRGPWAETGLYVLDLPQ